MRKCKGAKVDKKDLEYFKNLLLEERRRVLEELGWVEKNYIGKSGKDTSGEISSFPVHPADAGTDSMEMEKAYLIGAASSETLEDIEEALQSIERGDYGKCVECGKEIPRGRLEALPYAKLCLECKARSESEGA